MRNPRFSDEGLQAYVKGLADSKQIGAVSEPDGLRMLWYPAINGERVPCKDAPFKTRGLAKAAARDFQSKCRAELGETE